MDEEELIKSPKDRKFYNYMAFFMFSFGLNSQEWYWYKTPTNKVLRLQRVLVSVFEPVATASQIFFVYLNFSSYTFQEMTVHFAIIPISIMIMSKILISQTESNKKAMRDFMGKIHLYNIYKKNKHDKYVRQALITTEKCNQITFWTLMSCCLICTSAWQVVPIRHNIVNNPDLNNVTARLEIIAHVWLPFDYEHNFYLWCIVQVVASYCCYSSIGVMFTFDSLNMACIYHLIGQIQIFRNKLKTRFKENLTQHEVKLLLAELTNDYNFIKDSFLTFESAFGLNIVGIYAQNLIEGCIILFTLTSDDLSPETVLTYGLLIPSLQGILILLSYTLEYLRALTIEIPDLVYDLEWEDMSLSNQKMVQMLLVQVQPVLEFKAALNVKTGFEPAINILKTTFTYYVMIKTNA